MTEDTNQQRRAPDAKPRGGVLSPRGLRIAGGICIAVPLVLAAADAPNLIFSSVVAIFIGFGCFNLAKKRQRERAPGPAGRQVAQPEERFVLVDPLANLAPKSRVTRLLVTANVLVFIALAINGVDVLEPSLDDLVRWGSNFGPRTLDGEPWRLLSCMFVHIGLLHIGINMFVLWDVGSFVERLVGGLNLLAVYVVSGLLGSVASIASNPLVVSAGASGAIFGVYGALLGFIARQRSSFPAVVIERLRNNAIFFVGYNVLFGALADGIDLAAHLGGLVAGCLGGLLLSRPVSREPRFDGPALAKLAVLVVAGAAITAGGFALLPRSVVDYEREISAFSEAEHRAVSRFNEAVEKSQAGEIGDAELAEVLAETLGEWRAARQRLETSPPSGLPAKLRQRWTTLKAYAAAREESWDLLLRAVTTGDEAVMAEAGEKEGEVRRLLSELNDGL